MNYLKIGKATELTGSDKKLYRLLEIIPGLLSWLTLILLIIFSYFYPIYVAYFLIAFDVYWLLLVFYLGIHLIVSYFRLKNGLKDDWKNKCINLGEADIRSKKNNEIKKISWKDLTHLIVLPTYNEPIEVIEPTFNALIDSGFPLDAMIIGLAVEERGGEQAIKNANEIQKRYGDKFKDFIITIHPDGIEGELKGKGANQAWAAKIIKKDIIDKQGIDYDKIVVSVFDIDTVIYPDYFYCLTYKFLTSENPYRSSFQPIPIYHNNFWQAPFFARIAANSNTFWQMMQQLRQEKLATYSSHSMSWNALVDIGFWSTKMVSEDSRIFWHCYTYYRGDYIVIPMHYPVSMDVCMGDGITNTAINLYKQQRRWGWGVENVPYLMFNTIKLWKEIPKRKFLGKIFYQLYGFHSWATNALIIALIGWMPLILGGDSFSSTVLSTNLPFITRSLMMLAMVGLVLSAVISTLFLPPKPKNFKLYQYIFLLAQWLILPISIVIFGAVPGLESQTRLMFGKYLGFWVTPKNR